MDETKPCLDYDRVGPSLGLGARHCSATIRWPDRTDWLAVRVAAASFELGGGCRATT
jgi:hypothetical protein